MSELQVIKSATGEKKKEDLKGPSRIDIIENYLVQKYEFRFNEVSCRPEIKALHETVYEPITDFIENSLLRELQKNNIRAGQSTIRNILHSDFSPAYNPLKDYFFSLPQWDGATDYIYELAQTVTTSRQDLWEKCFRKWLVAMVASCIVDNIINHTVIIFSGRQGIGKTTWMENLVPPQLKKYLFSGTINPNNKDTLINLIECMLINLDELENLNRTEIGTLKELITKTNIRLRRPYGHNTEAFPRRASLMGSVNTSQFLNDTTGSRRFLPFEVTAIQYMHGVHMDKVYAQALHLFRSGFRFWLSDKEIDEITQHNEAYQVRTVEEELLLTRFEPADKNDAPMYLNASQMLKIINDHAKISMTTGNVIALGKALKKHGFEKVKKYSGYVYPVRLIDANQESYNNAQKPWDGTIETPVFNDKLPF